MTPLECTSLSVGYEGRLIVSDVSFDLRPGEVVALLGPNGSGKSTLLKTLSGLLPKICGGIVILGDDLDLLSIREVARRVAFVPQEEAWYFAFTVEEVVSMGRLPVSNGYFESQEDIGAAREAMREGGCYELRHRPVNELSGGERQRVLIARALAQDAPILFLDEPTSHLDPQFQMGTVALLRRLAGAGKSILVAVHDLSIAGLLADRALLIHNGSAGTIEDAEQTLSGEGLEAAYQTRFDRIRTEGGRLIVVPRLS